MKLFNLILYLFTLPFVARSLDHWDVAVATEATLDFITSNGDVTFSMAENFTDLTAIAFDPSLGRVFIADAKHHTSTIFHYDMATKIMLPLNVPKLDRSVTGMAYDAANDTLYWTNGAGGTISKIRVDGSEQQPSTFLSFTNGEILDGITIDKCRGVVYWVNSNHRNPSIERASLDGTDHRVIVHNSDDKADKIFQPLDIAVDYDSLYWSEDSQGIYYTIERSDLDGNNRVKLVYDTYHRPIAMSVGPSDIFWSDRYSNTVWTVPKKAKRSGYTHTPHKVRRYGNDVPVGLITSYSTSCQPEPETSDETSSLQNDDPTTITHSVIISSECDVSADYCLNGIYEQHTCQCVCHSGFTGSRCEKEPCLNFCMNDGDCFVNSTGNPLCECKAGYAGERCHVDACYGYCLNGGRCRRGKEPLCECGSDYGGKRCETRDVKVFDAHNATQSASVGTCVNGEIDRIIIVVLGTVIVVMMMSITFLVRKVCVLRKRPRIKKHIIVNKKARQTPLTSRPNQGEQCEITIENCCNMNICETPCFEPQLRTTKSQSKTEEKKNLLGSMEESSNCPPPQEDLY